MNELFNEKYPVLNDTLRLLIFPNRVEVLDIANRVRMEGNSSLGILLKDCIGKKTIADIARENTDNEEEFQESLTDIAPLIAELLSKNILSFADEQCHRQTNVVEKNKLLPSSVHFELTDRCNIKCVYCYQESSPDRNDFLKNPIEILEYLKNNGLRGVELTGGEPMLHPEFESVLEYCCKNFSFCSLITNGVLLKERHLEIMKFGPAQALIQVCLDGPDKETVDAISRVKGTFGKKIKAIKSIKRYGILLRIGMVLESPESLQKINDTLELAKELGAESFLATPVINFGRARENDFMMDNKVMEEFGRIHLELKEKYGDFYSRESDILGEDDDLHCGAGSRSLAVNWTGQIKICALQPLEWLHVGDIHKLEEDEVQDVLTAMSELKSPGIDICKECNYLYYCMNCFLRPLNLWHTGKIKKEDCEWYREHIDQLNQLGL